MTEHPYHQGRAAYVLGVRLNPHPEGSFEHSQWQLGWLSQAIDARAPAYREGREGGLQAECRYPAGSMEYLLFMHGQLDSKTH